MAANRRHAALAMALASALPVGTSAGAQDDPVQLAIANQRALVDRQAQARLLEDLAISPDGARLFYASTPTRLGAARGIGAARTGHLLDLGTGRSFAITPPQGDGDLGEPQWRPAGDQLAFLSAGERRLSLLRYDATAAGPPARTDLSAFAQAELGQRQLCGWLWVSERNQLLVAALSTPQAREALAPDPAWIRWSAPHAPSGDAGATNQLSLYAIDLATGAWRPFRFDGALRTPLACIGGLTTRLSHEGGAQAELIFAAERVVGRFGARVDITHGVYRLDLDAATAVLAGRATDLINGVVTTPGGGRYAVFDDGTTERDQAYARNHYYRIGALQADIRIRPVPGPALSLPRLFAGPGRDSLIALEDTRPNGRLIEIDARSGRRTEISPPELSVSDADVSADGRTIAAVLETLTDAPAIHVRRAGSGRWTRVDSAEASAPAPGQVRRVSWPSRDGRFQVSGLLVYPRAYREGRLYPLIVSIHGGPASGAVRNSYGPLGDAMMGGLSPYFFAEAGYFVFLPNFRGDVGASLEFYQASHGRPGDAFDLDIEAGVDRLIQQGLADERRMALFAHSAGGTVLAYALNRPGRYRAAVSNDAALMPDLFDRLRHLRGLNAGIEGHSAYFGIDMIRDRWLDARNISIPLLMRWQASSCGDRPLTSPPCIPFERQSDEIAPVLANRGIPFDVIVDRDRHVIQDPEYAIEYERVILAWFDRFLPGAQ